jgi:hypothetical protein
MTQGYALAPSSATAGSVATAGRALVICAGMAFPGLRYSKIALLVFGAGLVLGLVVVSVRLPGLARVASVAMALGIAALPVTLFADWRRKPPAAPAKRRRKAASGKRHAAAARRGTRRRR